MEAEPLTADEIAEIRALDIDDLSIHIYWRSAEASAHWISRKSGNYIGSPLEHIPRLLATIAARDAEITRLRDGLSAVWVYGSDTLSGPSEPCDARAFFAEGVREMTRRSRLVLQGIPWD